MGSRLRLQADLSFAVTDGGREVIAGTVTGSDSELTVALRTLDAIPVQMPRSRGLTRLRGIGKTLLSAGVTVHVVGPSGPLVSFGHEGRPVRVRAWRDAIKVVRLPAAGPDLATLLPPATMWPPAPTMTGMRGHVRTTHDPDRGGRPRLVFSMGPAPVVGAKRRLVWLRRGVTTIGSDPGCDVVLPGLAPQHCRVEQTEDDEYVVVATSAEHPTRVAGAPVERAVLRTGAHLDVGSFALTYVRDEHADHGRPYGGREGGEFSRQRPQPPPTYRRPAGS